MNPGSNRGGRSPQKRRFPWRLLALDFAGAALVALGFFRYITAGQGVLMIAVGLLMMLPLVFHILGLTGNKRE